MSDLEAILSPREAAFDGDAALDQMMVRLEAIIAEPRLTQEGLVEITAIFNNVSYLFLYLEANDDTATFKRLLPRRDAFYRNKDLDARILEKITPLTFNEPGVERSRKAYVEQLTEKSVESVKQNGALDCLRRQIVDVEQAVAVAQSEQLEALGVRSASDQTSVSYYQLTSRARKATTRDKLSKLWTATGRNERLRSVTLVDELIEARHRHARENGAETALALTLKKCSAGEHEIAHFLDAYAQPALVEQARLNEEIATELGLDGTSTPLAHFSYYLRQKLSAESAPLFDLDRCLNYIFEVARAAFGIDLVVTSSPSAPVIVAEAMQAGRVIGRINFDLWLGRGRDLGANHTLGLRNRAAWGAITQIPEAWVSCRFEPRGERRYITFQNVHSFFHEFGHAINHLLVRENIPNQSGLEYLPLERLEFLSMWSEKWAYHRDFAAALQLDGKDKQGLETCQLVKKMEYRRTYAERAVTALLDFECHRRPGLTLSRCFDELNEKYGVARFVQLTDFPFYFTWPMFVAHPGANFAYLWGAAWSCAEFLPLKRLGVAAVRAAIAPDCFDPCFNLDATVAAPDPRAVFDFYQTNAPGASL